MSNNSVPVVEEEIPNEEEFFSVHDAVLNAELGRLVKITLEFEREEAVTSFENRTIEIFTYDPLGFEVWGVEPAERNEIIRKILNARVP